MFYMADAGKTTEQIKRSVFVEKLEARGYEVLLFTEPLDEVLVNTLRTHKYVSPLCDRGDYSTFFIRKMPFQDVAKAGLKFGDEGRRRFFVKHSPRTKLLPQMGRRKDPKRHKRN